MSGTLRREKKWKRYKASYNKRDGYFKWKWSKANRMKLVGRNYCGKNVMRIEIFVGESVGRRKQILICFMKGWRGEYGPKLRDYQQIWRCSE